MDEEAVLRLAEPLEAFFLRGIRGRGAGRLSARMAGEERKGGKDRSELFHKDLKTSAISCANTTLEAAARIISGRRRSHARCNTMLYR